MIFSTGVLDNPAEHHDGWFKVIRFQGAFEMWFGRRWINILW
jgi:hypothetical protein